MMRALYSAASGMAAQQTNVDNIANNLANANTAGFKSRQVQFQDLLYQNMVTPGASAGQQTTVPTGLQVGLGTRTSGNEVIFTQGNFQETDNPYDLVIQGKGFFQIKLANGELAYTRAGSFQTDQNGILVDTNGNQLQPAITIPADSQSVTIATDGTVSYTLPNQTASQTAGQIQLANFQNPAGLNSLGQNYFQPTDASGQPVTGNPGGSEGLGTVLQGYTEQSNVSVVNEFINLIVAQRTYEANSKVVKASDEMLQDVNNLKQ
jgi:flagellar basal-body rod protein FlgG